jgi:hypothetical protein
MYWPEALLLALAWIVPIVAWLVSRGGLMFSRSGSLMVFFAAIAEFVMLHRANKKHLLNAQRVRAGQAPVGFSNAATISSPVTKRTLMALNIPVLSLGSLTGRDQSCICRTLGYGSGLEMSLFILWQLATLVIRPVS